MTDFDRRAVPRRVTEAQVAEHHGEFLAAVVMLLVFVVAAVVGGNLPGALLLGGFLAVTTIVGIRRLRNPMRHLTRITGPISAEILRDGRLEPRPGEDPMSLRIRVVDTMDLLRPRGSFGGWSRRLAFAVTFVAGLKVAGLLGAVPWDAMLVGMGTGLAVGFGTGEWPKRRRARAAAALLRGQLEELRALEAGEGSTPHPGPTPAEDARA